MAKKSSEAVKAAWESKPKKTSQARRKRSMMKLSSLNKGKTYKPYRGQGRSR